MANNPHKIKFFIGTPKEVEKEFNDWMAGGGGYIYSYVNMTGTAEMIVVSLVYYYKEERGVFY